MHGLSELLLELGAFMIILGGLAILATKLKISPIPFYLMAGLAFGEGGVIQLVNADHFIETSASIGVVLLLLMLGLEYSPGELRKSLSSTAPAGAVDFLLNFFPGFIAGILLGWSVLSSLVLGGITYVSSSGVIAKTLNDLGRLGNRETPTILSILVLEGLVMAIYLPVISGLLFGGGVLMTISLVTFALLTVWLIFMLAIRYGHLLSKILGSGNNEVLVILILGITLLVAGFAERVGVSAGVGAFLVGIAISGPVAHTAKRLLEPLRDVFAAAFFAFFGLQTNISNITPVILHAVILAVVSSITKYATGYWAASKAGIGTKGCKRAGIGLIARGEFSIIIAGLATASGLETIDKNLGALAASYVLILAIGGPLLTRLTDLNLHNLKISQKLKEKAKT